LELLLAHGAVCLTTKNGTHPIDLCIKERYTDCTLMLLKKYPELLQYVLDLVFKSKTLEQQLLCCLKAIMSERVDVMHCGVSLLESLCIRVQQKGMELLSVNSDTETLIPQFLCSINILSELYVPPTPPSPIDTGGASRSTQTHRRSRSNTSMEGAQQRTPPLSPTSSARSVSFSTAQTEAPHKSKLCYVDILKVLEPVWGAIDSWFDLLLEEIRRADLEPRCGLPQTAGLQTDRPAVAAAIVHSVPPTRRRAYLSPEAKKINRRSLNLERLADINASSFRRSTSAEEAALFWEEGKSTQDVPETKCEEQSSTLASVDAMADRLCAATHGFALCCKALSKDPTVK
jgi:hypothetical protein